MRIADDMCYVCGVRPVQSSGRCSKCQAVNRSQKEPSASKAKVALNSKTLKKARRDDFQYDIQVGE